MRLRRLAALLTLSAGTAAAQAPTPIDAAVAGRDRGWIAWTVPGLPGKALCCHDRRGRGECDLDGRNLNTTDQGGAGALRVYVHVEDARARRIRALSESCPVATGGIEIAPVSATSAQSLAWLQRQAGGHLDEEALVAIAFHADEQATRTLEELAGRATFDERKNAAFWLGVARGEAGHAALVRLSADPDPVFREELTFPISQSDAPGATRTLIGMARRDPAAEVRRQALFWLGQRAGAEARRELERAVSEDPEQDVKEHAVFALSQLPEDEAVPALIRLARRHPNPGVREKAMFWLGQTGDERALTFFEDVLGR